ncbi:MAG: Gfo/Idh/MocA family oxidoreductase [Streptosporangiaceae bacterium]
MNGRNTAGRMRVIVCGTKFGQVYLQAFRQSALPFELAGILAQGSERSRACAQHYGVPLWASPDELPAGIDIACVVVRGGLLGGPGAELAKELMGRGINVIQEHPLHHDELADCLRCARRHGVVYHLSSFYPNVAPVRSFIAAARELFRCRRPLYADAACGFQLAYALLDILGRALGGVRPWSFTRPPGPDDSVLRLTDLDIPFRGLDGVVAGVPVTLRIQNQMDPADPDNYAHLMHRITLGTEGGNLTLAATHGPLLWCPRPDFPREAQRSDARPHFAPTTADRPASGVEAADPSSGLVLGESAAPGYQQIFQTMWPAAIGRALLQMREAILAGDCQLHRGQYHLTVCQLWQDITALLGPPELLRAPPPRLLSGAELAAVAGAASSADSQERGSHD